MGVVRIQAIGPGAVEYLLHGCDPKQPEPGTELEAGAEPAGVEGPELTAGQERQAETGVGYFLDGRGEPAGVWIGSGMESLGFSYRAGDTANENDVRAVFGELRYPGSQWQGSTKETPEYLRGKPRNYRTLAERVEAALKAEPDASPERQREIEVQTGRNSKSNTAYYDVTFSPVKSVSVYYAALLANGENDLAQQVRAAHDLAVRLALESVEEKVAWAKTGRHGRASASGRTTGRWEKSLGLSAVLFAHHTNRDGEPQLHAHAAVLNVVATDDGRHYALDGAAFRPVKDGMSAAYDRALEAILSDLLGVVWVDRPDGHGREIAGVDQQSMDDASTRSRHHVEPEIERLIERYNDRHGHEPGPRARRQIVDQAVKNTRRPKTGPAGPAAVKAWNEKEPGRAARLRGVLDSVGDAVRAAARRGDPEPARTGYVVDGKVVASPEMASDAQRGQSLATAGQAAPGGGHPDVASGQSGQSPVAIGQNPRASGQAVPGPGTATGQPGAGVGQPVAAQPPWVGDPALAAVGAQAVAMGLERVQLKYPTWQVGALKRQIDDALVSHFPPVALSYAERDAWVWSLAHGALVPGVDSAVVQVSMGDPVPIAPQMRREIDGRSELRAPIDERYVTASHLSLEKSLAATAQAPAAPALEAERVGVIAEDARTAGLSGDQVAAVAAILGSNRQVDVLVGPAGAGKSHTLAAIARAWQAEHGGRVIGTAAAEVATRNLRELGGADAAVRGLAEMGFSAVNIAKLKQALEPDQQGRVKLVLQANDLLVIDEAGMIDSRELNLLTGYAARAGAKVIWAGDHRQLPPIGAGGMFAHLAEQPGAVELEQVHRFSHTWERDASLRLRAGDAAVAPVYANEGRLRAGSLEQMEYLATRDYVADRLAGYSGLLIVGTNETAKNLSKDIQHQLTELGLVGKQSLTGLRDGNVVRMGDRIQARSPNARLRVDAPPDASGRRGTALPVANRQVFTVVGFDPATGTVYGRDDHGNVAQLTREYVKKHVTLAYAVTNNAAQGVTVDRARAMVDRMMSANALYPASTRGRHLNMLYLVTERDPDPHHPQRERDTAITALVAALENDTGQLDDAALTVQAAAALESRSMLTLTEHYDQMATEQVHRRYAAIAVAAFGTGVEDEAAFPAMVGRMRALELEGHDINAVFADAKRMRGFSDASEQSKVMWWRLGVLQERREPEFSREQVLNGQRTSLPAWEQLAAQHHERAEATGDNQEAYLAAVAQYAGERTAALGVQVAAEPPEWALEWLGPLPDPEQDSGGHAVWVSGAGQVAAYREWRGIPDEQISIGSAPPPSQQLAHELWRRAAETGTGDPRVVDWRKADDGELRAAIRRWNLQQQWAPPSVADERGEAIALAHDATNDAAIARAQLAVMDVDNPARIDLLRRINTYEVMAEQATGFVAGLDEAHATREAWWETSRDVREAARGAQHELHRRGLPLEPDAPGVQTQPAPDPQPANEQQPEPDPESAPDRSLDGRDPQQRFDLDLEQERMEGPQRHDPGFGQPLREPINFAEVDIPRPEHVRPQPAVSERHQQFLDRLAAAHQQALDDIDPDHTHDTATREAMLRARSFETFTAELRAQHGARLDPDQQLSDLDLAHARAAELAEPPAAESADTPDAAAAPRQVPDQQDPTPAAEPAGHQHPGVEPELDAQQGPAEETAPDRPAVEQQDRAATPEAEQPSIKREPGVAQEAGVVAQELGLEEQPDPALGGAAAEDREVSVEAEEAPAEDGTARLARVAREMRTARIQRETAQAVAARAERVAEQGMERPLRTTAAFDRDAVLDDEIAAHRAPRQAEAAQQLQRDRDREQGLDLDD